MTCRLGGLSAALLSAFAVLLTGEQATANLPSSRALLALSILVPAASAVGYLAGSASCRRAIRRDGRLTAFSAVAGGVAGGMIGSICALTLTAAYFTTYLQWPADRLQEALVVLAYPAFALLGLCFGAIPGLVLGFVGGGVLRILTFRR